MNDGDVDCWADNEETGKQDDEQEELKIGETNMILEKKRNTCARYRLLSLYTVT